MPHEPVPRLKPVIIATLSDMRDHREEISVYCERYHPRCTYKAVISYAKWIARLGANYEPAKHNGKLRSWQCPTCGGRAHSLRCSPVGTMRGPFGRGST